MKHMIIIALFVLSMSACAQQVERYNLDTIANVGGNVYLNTFDDIFIYHESDWHLFETKADKNGEWIVMYYNDTSKQPAVYVYFMTEEICWKRVTYTDAQHIEIAEAMTKGL